MDATNPDAMSVLDQSEAAKVSTNGNGKVRKRKKKGKCEREIGGPFETPP